MRIPILIAVLSSTAIGQTASPESSADPLGANLTASAILEVGDSDAQGPSISDVIVSEHNGDGDGIIGTGPITDVDGDSAVDCRDLCIDRDDDQYGDAGGGVGCVADAASGGTPSSAVK